MNNDIKEILGILRGFVETPLLVTILKAIIAVSLLMLLSRFIRRYVTAIASAHIRITTVKIIDSVVRYAFWIICAMYVLGLFGINLNALLGAAGIAGVAVGFAAQTSVSNVISGFFVLTEKSLKLGDLISIANITGTVDSLEILSVKLRTQDNQMVRIPNETIIKSNLVNLSYFPTRRLDLPVRISYDADLRITLEAINTAAAECPLVLLDPEPSVLVSSFEDSGITLTAYAWYKIENQNEVRNSFSIAIQKAFAARGIGSPVSQAEVRITQVSEEA